MTKLAAICIQRPIFASMLILSMVVVGATAFFRLGVDRLPSVDLPTVTVRTSLAGASPEEIETQVSQKIEEVVNTVQGIEELRSISATGNSYVIITFGLNINVDVAAQDVRDRVATVIRDLPNDTDPPVVSKFDNDATPVITLALSGPMPIRELSEVADKTVREQLERSIGVGEVDIFGNRDRSINIWVDADRLAAHNIPVTAVRDAVLRQNAEVPGGNLSGNTLEQVVRTMGRITDPRQFGELAVTNVNGVPIKIKDVARVEDGEKEERSVARLNGVPAVSIEIQRQSGANTVEVIEGIKKAIAEIQPILPPGVKLQIIRDQSRYIDAALHEINTHLVLGSILACLVVLAFMRSWRSTIIAGIAIPASVISTFAMMWLLHFTLNSVTMLALVLMVGIVIDDAIVVLENIFRFVEEKKMSPMEAARLGTGEIALAVLATTLSLVVIFIPVSFMSSISGRFLYQFGITAAVAVMVSLLVSFTLTPMMSSRFLKHDADVNEKKHKNSRGGFYGYIDGAYTGMLRFVMQHRAATTVFALLVIASSVPAYWHVRTEFTPSDPDEAEFEVQLTAPEGTAFNAMNGVLKAVEQDIRATRGVTTLFASIGGGGGLGGSVNGGRIYVRIEPHEKRYASVTRFLSDLVHLHPWKTFEGNYTQADVMRAIRAKLRKYTDLRTSVANYPSFNIGGGNFDIDFVIRGPELEKLSKYTEDLRLRAMKLGIIDPDTTLKLNKPELRVTIDRERANDLGINSSDIGTAMRLLIGGDDQIDLFHDNSTNEDYDIQLRLEEKWRTDAKVLPRLLLPRANNQPPAELRNVASLKEGFSPSRIDRYDRQRAANVRSRAIAPGYALADRIEAMRGAVSEMNLPPQYSVKVAGRGRELERTFGQFLMAFALSIVFMYMILASNYESLVHPFTILLSLPLSIPFALLSLWATGGTLNLYSALGILVLFGVVKKNAILQIDHMNHLRHSGMERSHAIIEGNRDRLRPILMTTLALVGGMLPLALGTGPGSEERRAVATVVIGGQTLSLLITLLVTPVAYSLFDDVQQKLFRKKHKHTPPPSSHTTTRVPEPETVGV